MSNKIKNIRCVNIEEVNIRHFCNIVTEKHVIVETYVDNLGYRMAQPGIIGSIPLGVLLCDIVEFDDCHPLSSSVSLGSKVKVCTEGIFCGETDKKPEIGQFVYYTKKGKLTTVNKNNVQPVGQIIDWYKLQQVEYIVDFKICPLDYIYTYVLEVHKNA